VATVVHFRRCQRGRELVERCRHRVEALMGLVVSPGRFSYTFRRADPGRFVIAKPVRTPSAAQADQASAVRAPGASGTARRAPRSPATPFPRPSRDREQCVGSSRRAWADAPNKTSEVMGGTFAFLRDYAKSASINWKRSNSTSRPLEPISRI
jgi:hypothetical protein